jgi:hypothetical protein
VVANAEQFRANADECYRLSARLQNPEHRAFAVYLAGAWLALAEQSERKQAMRDDAEATLTRLTSLGADDPSHGPVQPEEPLE